MIQRCHDVKLQNQTLFLKKTTQDLLRTNRPLPNQPPKQTNKQTNKQTKKKTKKENRKLYINQCKETPTPTLTTQSISTHTLPRLSNSENTDGHDTLESNLSLETVFVDDFNETADARLASCGSSFGETPGRE